MAYFALLWKARTIEKYRLKYEKEKINSIVAANAELPKHTFYQKWKLYRHDSQKKLGRLCRRLCPEGSRVSNFFVYLKTDQTFSNFLVKSVIGFVGGIVLTYFWFMFFVFQLSISLIHATIMSSIIGVLLTLGLAFSYRIRCLVFLLIPQFFSRVGRYTLTCYALVLILTGPATNTLKNSEVLSESLACGQEQVKSNVNKLSESMNKPLYLMRDTIGTTVKKLKCLTGKVKEMMVEIHRLTMSLAHVLQSSLSWLNSVEAICNAKVGSPYEHCTKVLSHDLRSSKGKSNLDYLVQAVCFNLKTVDSMCVVGDFAKGSIVATVKKKLETFSTRISSMMFVAVHVKRSHSCYSNASRSASQVAAGIVTEIRTRADPLLTWLSWSSCLTSLFLLLIIFRAKYYQQMFETRSRFDNRYVTKELRDLDLRRLRQGRETVLPLNTRERAKYVSTTSFRLLASERVHLTRSIVFMVITTFKLLIHMVADYSLYWVLMNIRFHGRFQTVLQPGGARAGVKVAGSGPLPGIVRGLIDALSVPLALPSPSPISCLPNPHPPDFQRYAQIGILILLLWLCALCEPYGLRLRHVIMGHYQPERARARASWLYNHILRTRGCFLKHARRKLHREYKHSTEEKQTFKRWLTNIIPCRCLRFLLGLGPKEPHCLLCGTKQLQNDPDTYLKRCETPTCPGIYCARCFLDIGQLCTICLSPRDYGDLSDVSLEKWSSEDSDNDDSDNDRRGAKEPLLRMTDKFSGVSKHERLLNNNNNITKRTNRLGIFPKSKDQSNNHENINFLNYNRLESEKVRNSDAFKNQSFKKKQLEEKIDLEKSVKECNTRVVVRDADRLLKTVDAPKEKLSGIMNTIRLLTKKMDAGEIHKEWKKHDSNKFEYLVMELFQPIDIFKKALFVRHTKHANSGTELKYDEKDESLEEVIPFLRTYEIDNKIETNVDNTLRDENMDVSKTIQNIVDIENKTQFLHSTKSKTSIHKRDIKGIKQNYVKLKQTISADVMRLRKRRIYFSKIQFIPKRRRRNHPKKCIILQTMRVGKALNESVESEIKHLKAKLEFEINKMNPENNRPKKTKNILDKKTFNDNIRKLSTNIVSDVSSDIKASDIKDESSTPEENRGNRNKDAEQENPLTTIVHKAQDNHNKCVLHGLCSRFWHLVTGFTPRKPISSSKQEEPSTNDIANHKRRKKPLTREQKHAYKTTMLNNDARNYRISLYLKEQDWLKQSDSEPPEHLNEVLKKLKKKAEKRKIKEAEILKKEVKKNLLRELKLKAKAELKLKKQMKKQLIAEEKQKLREQKKQLNAQKAKQTLKTKENKKDKKQALSKIKEEVPPKESSTSFAEKLLHNVVKEISTTDKVRLATPKICLSNNLNFYGFNNPILDLPEENLNLDEIFGDDQDTVEKDTVSEQDTKVKNALYHDVAEKHQCLPSYWPYDRYGGTQTGIEEKKIEEKLEAKAENSKNKKKRVKVETPKKITAKSIKSAVSEVYVEMKKPVDKMKHLCSCIKERTTSKTVARHVSPSGDMSREKAIHVVPVTISRSCQDLLFPAIFNKYTQSHVTKVKHCPTQCESDKCFCGEHDVAVAVQQETCTCAAQCTLRCQGENVRKVNVGTMHNNAYKRTTSVAIQYEHYRRCVNQGICELCENPKFPLPKLRPCQCHPCGEPPECPPVIPDAEEDRWSIPACWEERTCTKPRHKRTRNILCQCDPCGDSGSGSFTSIFCESDTDCTGNTLTDTICTHVAVDYNNEKYKRKRVNVVKKNNQSTTTDKQTLVDVSTITGDWWSPIIERKKNMTLEKKTGDYSINQKEKKSMEDKSSRRMSTKRYAPIKSHEQHQGIVNNGILSPSKYLLECQENDYEHFSPSIPPIIAMTCVKKLNEGRSTYAYGAHRHIRKGHKSKRLEESYSPRKKTQTSSVSLSPAKWRAVDRNEDTSHALKHYRRRNDKLSASQKSRSMQKSREKASRASKYAKRLHVTRSFTDNEKEGDSVAGHCNSTSSLAIT